jgi:SAM-dependent methyltransferase
VDINEAMLDMARKKLPGVPLHQADLLEIDLGRRFDVVACLFSSIGYLRDEAELNRGIAAMAAHLESDGVLIVEPWILPGDFKSGTLHGLFVDRKDLKLARMNVSRVEDGVAVMDMHHLVGTEKGIEYFIERHELTLFPPQAYLAAFASARLEVEHDTEGLMGRGLFFGRPGSR